RPTHWGNVAHQRLAVPIVSSAQDLGLWCVETKEHIEFLFTYNADVLEPASVSHLGEQVQSVLCALTIEADAPLLDYRVDGQSTLTSETVATLSPIQPDTPMNGASLPSTPAERTIAEVWSRLLEVSPIHTSDNFFDLGGHSLLAMRAVTEINRRLNATLTIRQLIFSTLAQLANQAKQSDPPTHTQSDVPPTLPVPPPRKGWVRHLVGKLTS
ncbi:MAG TPA: phosphopantetheine-binding protein, partial [Aquabacterium sp.]|nr:phosphopantetheine-binding protein [Aquabacterium sp.]